MQLVAGFAHGDDHHASATSAYLVFTSTLGFVQLWSKLLAAFTQVESSPSCIPEQFPVHLVVPTRNTYRE
jgi:hypothetical protein